MHTIQNRESRIGEMKEDKYTKGLAKTQVCAMFHYARYSESVVPKFIRLCMETPCWCPFVGHHSRRKPTETSVFEFSNTRVNSLLEEFINIKVIFILRQGMFR